MSLVEEWIADLRQALSGEQILVESMRVGVFFTAAQISTGNAGLAFTPRDLSDTVCCPKAAAAGLPSRHLAGRSAWELAEFASNHTSLRRAVGVAILNALSARAMDLHGVPGGEMKMGMDALEAACIQPDDQVAMVGFFVPFMKALKGRVASLKIIDKHSEYFRPEEQGFCVSPERANEAICQASIVIITGSALVEGGLESLLEKASAARTTVLAGPTASPWPPTFFRHGVDILGGIHVRDPQRLVTMVGEGGSGYFQEAAEKVSIVKAGLSAHPRKPCSPITTDTGRRNVVIA